MTIEESTDDSQIPKEWKAKTTRKRRIEMMLNGDANCRYSRGWTNARWCTRVDTDVEAQLCDDRNEWAHYEQGTAPAEAGITTYGDQCATAAGNAAPVVANKVRADVIEDTIELYVLDLAMHERLPEGCEEMDEYDENTVRRSLRKGEGLDSSINHGHFRKWRICVEKECRIKDTTAFWEADMGQNTANTKVWNKALRATQSFTRATGDSPSPRVIRFDLLRNRVQEEQQAEIQIAAVMGKNTEGEMADADATEIERLRGVQRRCRTVMTNDEVKVMTYAFVASGTEESPGANEEDRAARDRSSPWYEDSDARNLFFGEPSTDEKAVVMTVRRNSQRGPAFAGPGTVNLDKLTYGRVFFTRWGDCGAVLGQTPGAESESGPAWVRSWPRGARNG
jgi:hypothetical protein